MHKATATVLVTLATTSLATGLLIGPVSASQSSFRQELLAAHNHHRVQAGVQPLRWSRKLASQAQRWANYLAKTGRFRHTYPSQRHKNGENLLQVINPGTFSLTDYVNVWAAERKNFIPGQPFSNQISKSGNWADVGHYSQLVWQRTTKVGCGLATANNRDVLVCRYNPAGNIIGQRP